MTRKKNRLAGLSLPVLAIASLTLSPSSAFADDPESDPRLPDPAYTAAVSPGEDETAFDFTLKGYVFGFKLITARYKGEFGNNRYSVYSDLKTSGIAALLKKQRLWSYTAGHYNETDLKPDNHIQQNMNKKSRRIDAFYNYKRSRVEQKIRPRYGSMGLPPATKSQAFNSDDVNSAMLKILMTEHKLDGKICEDTIPVFDSKQHYSIRFKKGKKTSYKFDGTRYQALECFAYLEPISGYDPEDLPSLEERRKPVTVYFINRPEYGLYMPVKFTYKVGGFKATVKVKDAVLKNG